MQITIEVPDWMARDFTADSESNEFDAEIVERVLLSWYATLYDAATGRRVKVHLDGPF